MRDVLYKVLWAAVSLLCALPFAVGLWAIGMACFEVGKLNREEAAMALSFYTILLVSRSWASTILERLSRD